MAINRHEGYGELDGPALIYILIIVSFFSFVVFVGEAVTNLEYRFFGKQTTGFIVDAAIRTLHDPEKKLKTDSYYLTVEYIPPASDNKFEFEISVVKDEFLSTKYKDEVLVEYLTRKKAKGRIYQKPSNLEFLALLGCITSVIGLMIFLKIKGDKDTKERDRKRYKYGY